MKDPVRRITYNRLSKVQKQLLERMNWHWQLLHLRGRPQPNWWLRKPGESDERVNPLIVRALRKRRLLHASQDRTTTETEYFLTDDALRILK